jgi:hypothetical protein
MNSESWDNRALLRLKLLHAIARDFVNDKFPYADGPGMDDKILKVMELLIELA